MEGEVEKPFGATREQGCINQFGRGLLRAQGTINEAAQLIGPREGQATKDAAGPGVATWKRRAAGVNGYRRAAG